MSDEDQAVDSTEVNEDEAAVQAEETLKIGDQEISLKDAKDLLESGKTFKQLREEYPNVEFKNLVKDYTQKSQKLAELEKQTSKPANPVEQERAEQIRALANDPVFQEELAKAAKARETQLLEDLKFEKRIEELEAEFDGSNGEPKFDKASVLKYGMEHQIFDPKVAYKAMHEKEFEDLIAKRTLSKKPRSTFSERRGGMGSQMPTPKAHASLADAERAALARLEETD